MLQSLIRAALGQRLLVVVVALVVCAFGLRAAQRLSVDAFPDVTNVQVQVATEFQGRSPEEIERFVTAPLEIAMTGLPGLVEMRSLNKSGLSIITLVFTDKTDVYFARQLVTERLIEVGSRMPPGVTPVLGPVSTGLGEVYQYTLEHPDDKQRALTPTELAERRIVLGRCDEYVRNIPWSRLREEVFVLDDSAYAIVETAPPPARPSALAQAAGDVPAGPQLPVLVG